MTSRDVMSYFTILSVIATTVVDWIVPLPAEVWLLSMGWILYGIVETVIEIVTRMHDLQARR